MYCKVSTSSLYKWVLYFIQVDLVSKKFICRHPSSNTCHVPCHSTMCLSINKRIYGHICNECLISPNIQETIVYCMIVWTVFFLIMKILYAWPPLSMKSSPLGYWEAFCMVRVHCHWPLHFKDIHSIVSCVCYWCMVKQLARRDEELRMQGEELERLNGLVNRLVERQSVDQQHINSLRTEHNAEIQSLQEQLRRAYGAKCSKEVRSYIPFFHSILPSWPKVDES